MITLKIDNDEETVDEQISYLRQVIRWLEKGFTSGTNVWKRHSRWDVTGSEHIECQCDDSACDKKGPESFEVSRHIENCPCSQCHNAMGKV